MILPEGSSTNFEAFLVQLERSVKLFAFLMDLGDTTEDHGYVSMILRKLDPCHAKKLVVKLDGFFVFSLLVKTLTSIERSRGIINTIRAEILSTHLESHLVKVESFVKLFSLHIDSSQVVHCGRFVSRIGSKISSLDL
mmetsp:Transcript_126216/g.353477  ORF Transcript_126216/g.353477 Transcript_126216/m.353477 type:complete len:138 (+) Transcript_126216:986-1399(+)